jgi:chromosome partitioning protein
MKKPVIISVINHKGGTGKTTMSYNLAEACDYVLNQKERLGKKILLIDNDPQASLTSFFYDTEEELDDKDTIVSIYQDNPNYTKDIILATKNPNIDVVTNMFLCTSREKSLSTMIDGNFRIKKFVNSLCMGYDIIIIDNSPYFSSFTTNALFASDYVIIPSNLTRLSVIGIAEILKNIASVQDNINPTLKLLGILINMLDERYKSHHVHREMLYKQFGELVFITEIHVSASIQNAERKKLTIVEYNKNTRTYKEYLQLAREISNKIGLEVDFNRDEAYRNKLNDEGINGQED